MAEVRKNTLVPIHSHSFVENYDGFVGFGFNRETDEKTIMYYLQKFSDDRLVSEMTKRMTDDELNIVFDMISGLLKKHLSESEYHELFLKEENENH